MSGLFQVYIDGERWRILAEGYFLQQKDAAQNRIE